MSEEIYVYKIKRDDGLFSTGGEFPKFTKLGRIWTKQSHLKNHLTFLKKNGKYYNLDCTVVRYKLVLDSGMYVTNFQSVMIELWNNNRR